MKRYLLFGIVLLFAACAGRTTGTTATQQAANPDQNTLSIQPDKTVDSFDIIKPYVHEAGIYCATSQSVDTLIGNFHIRYKRMANDRIIIRHDIYKYADNSIYLDVSYKGKKIVSAKEFRTTDFPDVVPEEGKPLYELRPLFFETVTDSTIVFEVDFYMPDTDIGASALLSITSDGIISHEAIEEQWESDEF